MKKIILVMISICLSLTLSLSMLTKNIKTAAAITYQEQDSDFRAAWVSYYIGEVDYKNEEAYKAQIDQILDVLEYYNMNAMIFHMRAFHDAWYNSKINKLNTALLGVDFDEFDPIKYAIEETHKRGIEFHAWLNPYRLGKHANKEEILEEFASYPNNPASKAENILMGGQYDILDPGRPEVRDFLIDTCLEVAENYDVDAIHFDDYFYVDSVNDEQTRALYNTDNLSIDDFRRAQIDTFIYDLKMALDAFNQENNRYVQLGVAPSGVYRNASSDTEANTPLSQYRFNDNGDLIYPTGANIGCSSHYGSHLYCDTLKWVNNEWINYICPQTYWAINHSRAHFESLINWWNQAVSHKNVNLYSGMGIYMWYNRTSSGQEGEALKQLAITSNLEYVKGTSIFSFKNILEGYNATDKATGNAAYIREHMNDIKNKAWTSKTILPEITGFEPVKLGSVNNFVQAGNSVTFDKLKDAKFYVIYRFTDEVDYSNKNIAAIINGSDDKITWNDSMEGPYIYDVKPLSYTNTLGDATGKVTIYKKGNLDANLATDDNHTNVLPLQEVYNFKVGSSAYLVLDNLTTTSIDAYDWQIDNKEVLSLDNTGKITMLSGGSTIIKGVLKADKTKFITVTINVYENDSDLNKQFKVQFINRDGSLLKEEMVTYGNSATPPKNVSAEPSQSYYYTFAGWNLPYYNITKDMIISALFTTTTRKYHVTYKNANGDILKEEDVFYGEESTPPASPSMADTAEYQYRFTGWDTPYDKITKDTVITAVYAQFDKAYYVYFNLEGIVVSSSYLYHNEDVLPYIVSDKDGYVFDGWYLDEDYTQDATFPLHLKSDTTLYGRYLIKHTVSFYDDNGNLLAKKDVGEGKTATAPTPPAKKGYEFVGWDKDITNVTTDFSVNAVYKKVSNCSCQKQVYMGVIISVITILCATGALLKKKNNL